MSAGPDGRVARLRQLDCCVLSDALDALGLEGAMSGVPRQSGDSAIAGRAVTLKVGQGAPPAGAPRHLGTAAIELAGPDNIFVVEQRSGVDAGCWGGLLTRAAIAKGIAGAIMDGPVRDVDEASALNWPIFTRQLTLRTARGRVVELGTNVPVIFEGYSVEPGDYIAADRSGIVIVSPANIDAVLDKAETLAAKEAGMAREIEAGKLPSQVMAANYERALQVSATD